jgi:ribosomal protein S18 acetylase RimI-like enzyme
LDADPRARAIAYRHATHARVCDRVEPWAHGTAVFSSRLPAYWDYNVARLEGPDPGVDADALIRELDAIQAPLAHRRVEVEDEPTGARLRSDFAARGWATERLVWLHRRGAPEGAAAAEEVPFAQTRPLRAEWSRGSPWGRTEADVQGFMELEQVVAGLRGTRAVVARGAGGEPIGFATFSVAGDAAEIEQAYVTPAERDGGVGGRLVAAAAAASGAPEVFIVADDEGDSKRLYRRLGFEPVWFKYDFTRRP